MHNIYIYIIIQAHYRRKKVYWTIDQSSMICLCSGINFDKLVSLIITCI